jgi:hypothetical protein
MPPGIGNKFRKAEELCERLRIVSAMDDKAVSVPDSKIYGETNRVLYMMRTLRIEVFASSEDLMAWWEAQMEEMGKKVALTKKALFARVRHLYYVAGMEKKNRQSVDVSLSRAPLAVLTKRPVE